MNKYDSQSSSWPGDAIATAWRDKMQAAWPHVKRAILRRALKGENLEDLAGVVTEFPASEEEDGHLTIGVLTRGELAETIRDNADGQLRNWTDILAEPAPDGCIFVFGSFSGMPGLCTMTFTDPQPN